MSLIAALSGALIVSGILCLIYGIQRHPERPPRPARSRTRKPWVKEQVPLILAGGVGLLTALLTGWFVAILVVPAATWFVRRAWLQRSNRTTERLEALGEFARAVAGILTAGRGLEQAILQGSRSAPHHLGPEITKLAARLRANWPTDRALRAFADDVDDATGDLFVATLMLGAQRRGPGIASAMVGLADSIDAEVRARRAVEAEEQKPRTAARMITAISLVLIGGLFISGTYVAPYQSALGQALLTVYAGLYLVVLWWMGRISRSRPLPRFMGSAAAGREVGAA